MSNFVATVSPLLERRPGEGVAGSEKVAHGRGAQAYRVLTAMALGHHLNEHFQVGVLAETEGKPEPAGDPGVVWVPFVDQSFPFSVTVTQASLAALPFGLAATAARPVLFGSVFVSADLVWDNRLDFDEG